MKLEPGENAGVCRRKSGRMSGFKCGPNGLIIFKMSNIIPDWGQALISPGILYELEIFAFKEARIHLVKST